MTPSRETVTPWKTAIPHEEIGATCAYCLVTRVARCRGRPTDSPSSCRELSGCR
jgi:hypothetical protein